MRTGGEAAAGGADMLEDPIHGSPVAAPELTAERAFKDLASILNSVAASPSHYRNYAVHYMRCRSALLNGQGRSHLPGFLIQCGTSEKFRDFITLYDASVPNRHAFIDHALSRCRALFGWTRSFDVFDDEDF
jgi:hypothetical protein